MAGLPVVWNEALLAALPHSPEVLAQLMELSVKVVTQARADAPRLTGRGAESIHAELDTVGGDVRISWERDRYYMYFHERGAKHLPARPFLVPAADRYLYVRRNP